MEMILSMIMGPLGKLLGLAGAFLGLFLYGKYQKRRADRQTWRAESLEASVEYLGKTRVIDTDTAQKVRDIHEVVKTSGAAGLAALLRGDPGGVQQPGGGPGPTGTDDSPAPETTERPVGL